MAADGAVWLCAVWWKTGPVRRDMAPSIWAADLWLARWRDKWFQGRRRDESAACQLLHWSSSLLLMNRAISKCQTLWIMHRHSQEKREEKKAETPMETVAKRHLEPSLSSSLHWGCSLSPSHHAKKCILGTLCSEIMGPLIGPVSDKMEGCLSFRQRVRPLMRL